MRRSWISLIGLALAAGLAGCTQGGDAEPTPSPTPSTHAAVTPSPSPTPDMEALYAEAEWIVRRATELEEQAMREGQGSYPAELHDLLADPYLSWNQAGIQQIWELGWQQAPGESSGLILRPQPGVRMDGSELALDACLLKTATVDAQGSVVAPSEMVRRSYFFKHVDSRLKLFTSTIGTEIEQCPFA